MSWQDFKSWASTPQGATAVVLAILGAAATTFVGLTYTDTRSLTVITSNIESRTGAIEKDIEYIRRDLDEVRVDIRDVGSKINDITVTLARVDERMAAANVEPASIAVSDLDAEAIRSEFDAAAIRSEVERIISAQIEKATITAIKAIIEADGQFATAPEVILQPDLPDQLDVPAASMPGAQLPAAHQ